MKKLLFFSLALVLCGCQASIDFEKFQASSFSADPEITSPEIESPRDVFETKAFKDPEGKVYRYKLLRPLREDFASQSPLIVVLAKDAEVASHLSSDTFRTVYPAYTVIPEISAKFPVSQLLLQLQAYLPVDPSEVYLIAEDHSVSRALKLIDKIPKFFTKIALVDAPAWKLKNLDAISQAELLLFADARNSEALKSMQDLDKAILNYGGSSTLVIVDKSDGPILQQVYDDPEFWRRLFDLSL